MSRKDFNKLVEVITPLLPKKKSARFVVLQEITTIMTRVDPNFDSLRFMLAASRQRSRPDADTKT